MSIAYDDLSAYNLTDLGYSRSLIRGLPPAPTPNLANAITDGLSAANLLSGGLVSLLESQGGGIFAGKKAFDNTVAGFRLGIDVDDLAKFYIGNTTAYLNWDGTNLTIVGGVSVSSLNIPDTTTANSFHVDTSGNTWWGANVAAGYAGANAYVLATGGAVFKNVQIGGTTIQYTITDTGIFSFGDGSDGNLTTSGNVTLTTDKYYNNLTVSVGDTFNPAGFRIFVKGTLTVNGTIARNGNNGSNGASGATGGAGGGGGAALADGYLKGVVAGGTGGNGGTGGSPPGQNGSSTNTSNSIGVNGANGGGGGTSGDAQPGGSSTGGTATASNVKLISNWHLATLLDVGATGATIKFDNSASGASGGGGGGRTAAGTGGGGGGAGSGGAIIAIYARNIIINSGGIISSTGGTGGNGGKGQDLGGGGGGGAAGGTGGVIIYVYNTIANSGSITVAGGTGGTGGAGADNGGGNAGGNGSNGTTGVIFAFSLSL